MYLYMYMIMIMIIYVFVQKKRKLELYPKEAPGAAVALSVIVGVGSAQRIQMRLQQLLSLRAASQLALPQLPLCTEGHLGLRADVDGHLLGQAPGRLPSDPKGPT